MNCKHDVSHFNFTIWDYLTKKSVRITDDINNDRYLMDVLEELLQDLNEKILEHNLNTNSKNTISYYVDLFDQKILLAPLNELDKDVHLLFLRRVLQSAVKQSMLLSMFRQDEISDDKSKIIGEIYSTCTLCQKRNMRNTNRFKVSNETNFKSTSSKRNSEDDKLNNTPRTSKKMLTNRSDKMPGNLATCRQEEVNKLQNDVQKESFKQNLFEQKQSNDMDVRVSNQLHDSDTVPVSWLKEYMETMKDDMVYKITHEVTKKVTKKVLKHLDLHLQDMLYEQKWPQNISSLEQDSRGSSEPIEKNQEQKISEDKEQLSDASIEHIEEPQNADATKDAQVTKNERSTVDSKKIVKDISKLLHKTSVNPIASTPEKHEKSSDLIKKNGKETTPQIEEQLSDQVLAELQDATIAKDLQLLDLSEVKFIKDKIREFVKEKETKKYHQLLVQIAADHLEKDAQSQEESDENLFTASPQLRSIRSVDWKPAQIGHHMSCSVTGHQMLDETLQSKDMWSDRHNDENDKSSFRSCDREDDDDTFEIIQMPTSETENMSFEEPVVEQQEHDSNDRDSPSFELLTEPSSPCSIYITEDHFAAIEGKPDEEDPQANSNNPTNCDRLQLEFDKSVKSTNADSKKQSGGAYVTETLPAQDFNSFCKVRKENIRAKQRLNEGKYSRDSKSGDKNSFTENPKVRLIKPTDWLPERSVSEDMCGAYDDVRNSHTSYLTVQTQCDCQSQCANSGDLTQSFHSHTTSINDITDVSHRLVYTDNSHSSQMPSADGQDDAAAIPKSSLDSHVGSDRVKNVKTNERHDADNYPKCREFRAQDADAQHQFHRMNSGFVDRSSFSDGSGKAFATEQSLGPADSVHILPETLVSAAAQVGSFAYDTAREVFDKIRAHAKEDSTKRRSGTKSDHKKPFGNLPFI